MPWNNKIRTALAGLFLGLLISGSCPVNTYAEEGSPVKNHIIELSEGYPQKFTAHGQQEIPAKHHWVFNMVFYVGVLLIVAMCGAIIFFIVSALPKKIKVCPVSSFKYAQKIIIPSFQGRNIILTPKSEEFSKIMDNFTEEKQNPEYSTHSGKIYIKIRNRSYALEASITGWNFLGEEKNRRCLRNPIELAQLIDSAREKYGNP